jgi:hypothetical protein
MKSCVSTALMCLQQGLKTGIFKNSKMQGPAQLQKLTFKQCSEWLVVYECYFRLCFQAGKK